MKDKQAVIWTPLFRKIFLLVVSLFSLVFVLTLLSIYQAAYNQAEREFVARLNVGKNVFMNEIVIAKQHLDSSVETIAKDWALRSAIGQGEDTQSIKSVLSNHGKRINADIAIALDKKFMLIAQFGGEDMEIVRSLANVLDNKQQERAWIAMVADEPYIVSAEPINAPATIGWLLMGKKLNKQFFQRIKLLISLDINLIITRQNSHNLVLSTINNPSALAQEIENLASTYLKNKESVDMYITQANDSVMMPFDLFTNNQQQFVILLQDSMSAWLKSRNLFMLELVPFFIVGILLALLGSFLIARSISRPVSRLLTAAKLVASGSYTEHIKVSERSELGELASEFNNMQLAVMEREQKIKAQAEEIRQINAIKYQVDIAQKEQQLAANATEAKSRFLANVSHEIRTPLNSIIGYSELLSDVTVSKDDKIKATAAIHNGGQYLLNLVNDVLDLSKIEAGKIQLNKTDVSIVALVDEVRSHMDGFALEKNLKFNLQLHYPLPYEFNTDATRLKQILLNLCNNAIKFTEQGQVDLQVHLDTFRKRFIFVVSDTGPGMTDEQQMRLFTAFSQGNQSSSRKYGGTGLGLYISKQLTEILGGHIKVTSQKGQGSQFAVYMPWVQANNQKMMTSEAEAQNLLKQNIPTKVEVPDLDAHILCVDDNEDNRQLVAYLVNKTGAKLSLAESGKQAIELVQNHQFDLVLMDMQMPEMDGIQTTKLLLEQGLSAPIVMLTANVDTKSKNTMLAAGVKQHFAKPIHTQSFYHLLDSYLGHAAQREEVVDEVEEDVNEAEFEQGAVTNSSEFDQLIENYRNSFADKLSLIQQALQQEDWSEISRMMHNLKGSAGSYGFQVLSNLAKRVEDRIEQEKIAEAKKYLADLILCMQQLHQVDE
ncbi:ATP-binding protein [Paraglaciecola aquimarina]|uniref:histidine kinase n=1 Tax=Paraglaciecola algarum TaxID=3050085 RepID=A0ABS9D3Z4_9ALTE|nr:ATP-binding protein [Paraglaciecola sp. G1-23]MCF2947639.1 ATP-binding protein [Paraglaciecola sp. G1-23]